MEDQVLLVLSYKASLFNVLISLVSRLYCVIFQSTRICIIPQLEKNFCQAKCKLFLTTQSQIDLPPQLIDGNRVTSISVVENDSTLFFGIFFIYTKKRASQVLH